MPALMINGRYDFLFLLESSARQMFLRLGTPMESKRQVVIDSDHNVFNLRGVVTRKTLDRLDRYLGPVKLK